MDEFRPSGGSGTRFKGGPQDLVHDSKFREREKHQIKHYFNEVIESLPEVEGLVILGPETGQKLEQNHRALHQALRVVERSDKMTDTQLILWVKDYFA